MNIDNHQNKKAWEYRAYEFWTKSYGKPEELGKKIMENPIGRLKNHGKYFTDIKGMRIANPCGSSGRRAVALSLLGADVTIFDISEENKRYALELADAVGEELGYVVGDVYDINLEQYGECFHMLYLEGGILHYFHDIDKLMRTLYSMLKKGGKIVLNDFHPFRKIVPINYFQASIKDYFYDGIQMGEVAYKQFLEEKENESFPQCELRLYTLSEIINSMIKSGFSIKEVSEDASWTDDKLPGEITFYAVKE